MLAWLNKLLMLYIFIRCVRKMKKGFYAITILFRNIWKNLVVFVISLQIAKRLQNSWKSSVAEAESVLPGRPKMAPSIFASTDIPFRCSPPPEPENRPHPTFPPLSSPVSTLSEKLHITDELVLSPTPAKPSTLKKSSGKKKQSKSLKATDGKNSKKTPRRSPDQSDRDNGECPYSDLDSVPKILCPKALERQAKLAPSQPSVSVVKELKKQPELQSGLWFSKSGKERLPKTTNPVPDRSLFSKVPNKKKNGSTLSKKTLVSSASSLSGAFSDQASPEKHKPTHNPLLLEQSGPLKHKTTKSSTKPKDRSDRSVDQSGFLNQKAVLPVENSKVKQMDSNSADTIPNPSSDLLISSDVISNTVPLKKVQFCDQSIDLKSEQKVSQTKLSVTIAQNQVSKTDKIFDQEKENNKTSVSCLEAKTNDSESRLENQLGLVSRCRLPFVKLIRKEIKDKYLNSTVTVSPTSQVKCTKEKISDSNGIKTSHRQSDQIDKSSSSTGNSGPMKVAVKKLKASGGSDVLRLSDSLHSDTIDASNKFADELVFRDSEKISVSTVNPNNVTHSFSNESDQSQRKKTSDQTNKSSDQLGNVDQSTALTTATTTTPRPSKHNEVPVCQESVVPESPSSEKSTRDVHNSKLVSDVNEVLNKQPAHLPASNGLMTRALKAMHDTDQKKHEKVQKEVEQKQYSSSLKNVDDLELKPQVKQDISTKNTFVKSQYVDSGECDQGTSSCCSSPSVMFSDSNDFEPDVKSEDEDLSISSTPPMDFIPLTSKGKAKHEGQSSNILSTLSPPSPFSFMKDFKNVEEVSFQSLTNKSDGKPISFKTEKKYKFSTFLMMLKDLHDTREREGTPLELDIGPPSAHVKLEPLVLPQELEGQGQNMDVVLSSKSSIPNKSVVIKTQGSTNLKPKRPYNRRGSHWLKRRNNRRSPHSIRSGPGFPGLDSSSKNGMESLLKVDQSSRILEIQSSSWESQAECGKGEVERWRRLKGNQRIVVPLEQKERDNTQETGLLDVYTKNNTGLMLNVGDRRQALEGKYSLHSHRSTLYNICVRNGKNMGHIFKLRMKIDKLNIFV